ncbi:hypothetical protein ACJIZ3_023910 [Penstemon smallii]|uniref:Uncharacterized protein n=1 Tax=Penstemon smallii TaxID=265156 RepID=A0ABD3TQD5_9LAMI
MTTANFRIYFPFPFSPFFLFFFPLSPFSLFFFSEQKTLTTLTHVQLSRDNSSPPPSTFLHRQLPPQRLSSACPLISLPQYRPQSLLLFLDPELGQRNSSIYDFNYYSQLFNEDAIQEKTVQEINYKVCIICYECI